MQSKGQTAAKVIGVILVLALLAGIVAIIYRFTNGFNEDFKTFYVEHDGERILTTDSKLHLVEGQTHRFDVKYTFDTGNSEPKDYNVKVIPNAERDFDFTAGGERYLYSKENDLTSAFGLNKQDTYFELVGYILRACYPGRFQLAVCAAKLLSRTNCRRSDRSRARKSLPLYAGRILV